MAPTGLVEMMGLLRSCRYISLQGRNYTKAEHVIDLSTSERSLNMQTLHTSSLCTSDPTGASFDTDVQ